MLKADPQFKTIRDAIRDHAVKEMLTATGLPDPQSRLDRGAYARGLYDLWKALEAPAVGILDRNLPLPKLPEPASEEDEAAALLDSLPVAPKLDTAAALASAPGRPGGRK